jgi:murein L,D-transpeptidase YafK
MNIGIAALLLGWMLMLGGCGKTEPTYTGKADHSPYEIKQCLRELSTGAEFRADQRIDRLVAYKSKRILEGYRNGKKVFESRMSLGKNGDKGNKIQAGDYRTPEGAYTIVRKKCDPRLYRSLMISYPNEEDIARAKARGVSPGGYITIHGQPKWNADGRGDAYTLAHDWTEGCMAVPNKKMAQLWAGVRNGTPITIHP